MTREDIIRMAREAGLFVGTNLSGVELVGHEYFPGSVLVHLDVEDLRKFAVLIAAAERAEVERLRGILRRAYDCLPDMPLVCCQTVRNAMEEE